MLKKFVNLIGGDPNKRQVDRITNIVEQVNSLEQEYEALSEEALSGKTDEFRRRLAQGEELADLMSEAFAAVREASKRTIGLRHYDVQLIGGTVLHEGKIAEMRTGEGKTLVATLPLYLNALTGRGVHLITVNDYLARRDARWMAPIYTLLGMSVGVLQMAARTENGKKAFLVDLERESPHEDQHQLRMVDRVEAYAADITYGTNSEFGFDYLRDNMTMRLSDRVQRGHYYAIVDEVDNVLIDEARTPLIISGPAQDEAEWYIRTAQVIRALRPEDYEVNEKDRTVNLSEIGEGHVEELMGMPLRDPERPEDITPEQARIMGYLEQALRAQFLFKRNKDYLVQAGKVVIVDEFTGRLMPGRRWSDGLHQAVEAKEGVKVQSESVTYATITIQNYFRMYEKLAGMSGTAVTESEEFDKIYKLGVIAIPTNLEYQAERPASGLIETDGRDESGYKYRFYARQDDPLKAPVYWRRKDYPDVVYRTEEIKLREIAREVLRCHVLGQPVLVGTTSVELSERVSNRLRAEPLRRLVMASIIRHAWLEANRREEDGRQIPELSYLYQPLDKVDTGEMRKMGRDLGITYNPEEDQNLDRLIQLLNLEDSDKERLKTDLQAGIPHQVLNARKHTEESQIIARAGAFGAVTIATNMAGRGVDIKLGGEMPEDVLAVVNRLLSKAGYEDPYDMNMEERDQALQAMDPQEYGIYEAQVQAYLQHMRDMERVRSLGGLHIIGSERHEARRIDNQLRGRAARQGDPGSSRFYLSMEDDLMRRFGGAQADNLMQRMKIDDAMPLEVGLVGRIVESSQTRVEGANFDVRKHLLEYDDVLNKQRLAIYGERDRIFVKPDLNDDVTEMLRTEISGRVLDALKDQAGPWKLLSWLDQIQPSIYFANTIFPSYTIRLLVDQILSRDNQSIERAAGTEALLNIARQSILTEQDHLLQSIENLLNETQERLEDQVRERSDTLDTFFEGLSLEEEGGEPRRVADLVNDLLTIMRLPLKLTSEQQNALRRDPESVREEIHSQMESLLVTQAVVRLVGAIERRLDEPLEINAKALATSDWDTLHDEILDRVRRVYDDRLERYLGATGHIRRDIEKSLPPNVSNLNRTVLYHLLTIIPQGERASFDKKTHRRVKQRTSRLTYFYYAASSLEGMPGEDIAEDVLEHMENAQQAIQEGWGIVEFSRLASSSMDELDEHLRRNLREALGDATYEASKDLPFTSLDQPVRQALVIELGRKILTESYRQLLLRVITGLWVEYLTQVEALRVTIGLEAYGQRDPLNQYKIKASELFSQLKSDIRLSVINQMFTQRPVVTDTAAAAGEPFEQSELEAEVGVELEAEVEVDDEMDEEEGEMVEAAQPASRENTAGDPRRRDNLTKSKKRRRHRR